MTNRLMHTTFLAAILFLTAGSAPAAEAGYYKGTHLFSMPPDPAKSATTLTRFGPVGMSIDLIQPAFTMQIKSVEPGSPADATGQLKPGMIIQSINGEKLADINPRIQLGNMITKAEAGNGKMRMMVCDKPGGEAREVVVQLRPMGQYSQTWPLNCPKSDKIVRDFAEYLKKEKANRGFADIGMLFLLSTGEESDLAVVRDWARARAKIKPEGYSWHVGYGGLALAEYYLRTGDPEVFPAIQALADHALRIETFGGWASRGALGSPDYGGGGGHLSAGGVLVPAYLLLAKECGAEMPDESLRRIMKYWYRYAGRGNVPYGNNKPEGTYTDNGKNGKLAFSMAAAAALTPEGENSLYARARDVSALFSFTSTSFMLHGHTGGGIGEIWRSAAMGLLREKRPALYRDFMDQRRWHYEMSRRWDGSFAILGGERYDNEEWGAGYALTYTVPRKTLRITGAPPTKYSKPYKLPERAWGTAEDDDFVSIDAIAYSDGSRPDFTKDTLATGGAIALLDVAKQKLSDEDLQKYIRHPTIITRNYFVDQIVGRGERFVLALLSDPDARMRRLALEAAFKLKPVPEAILAGVIALLGDEKESWFVKELALRVVGNGSADQIAPHVDVLLPYLQHEEWWLQHSTLVALTPVVTDPRCYQRVLPAIGKFLESNHLHNTTGPLRWGTLPQMLRQAQGEVAELARQTLKQTYTQYVEYHHKNPEVEKRVNPTMREGIAGALAALPGGLDVLYEVSKQRSPEQSLPYQDLYLQADPTRFSPQLKKEFEEIVKTRLIPEYIGANRSYLVRERDNRAIPHDFYYRGERVAGLVDLYRRIGVNEYEWHDFGPVATEMSWHYLTFDPPEAKAWDIEATRYRPVTVPAGMENWFKPEFNPAEHGWKVGLQPFGATNGKLVGATIDGGRTGAPVATCSMDFCRHHVPMATLWDKEVLLLRGKFKFPPFKQGHRYRLLVGGMSHVGAGEGFKFYVNGADFWEKDRGVGKREGGVPIDKHLDATLWPTFSGQEVDIAHISFMAKYRGWMSRHLMIWVQEMKLPPLDDEQFLNSARLSPMTSAAWQALQDPDNADQDPRVGMYRWDGKTQPNPALLGDWRSVGFIEANEKFDPKRPARVTTALFPKITFTADGRTDNPLFIWTGATLLNLGSNEALQMEVRTIEGVEYLFVEHGGFQTKHGPHWKSPQFVMQRVK